MTVPASDDNAFSVGPDLARCLTEHAACAHALIRDREGRILSPRQAVRRQLTEALTLPDVSLGRLLPADRGPDRPDPLCGSRGPGSALAGPKAALARLPEPVRAQVQAGLHALATGGTAELDQGTPATIFSSAADTGETDQP